MKRLMSALHLTMAIVLLAPLSMAAAGSPQASVLQPIAHPSGATYGEWSARWWQWAFDTPLDARSQFLAVDAPNALQPAASSPVDCTGGQDGRVWFLAGTFPSAGTAHRSCTVPKGKALFFPVFNAWQDNLNFPGEPPFTLNKAQLRTATKGHVDGVTTMSATVDGRSIADVAGPQSHYRATSPFFSYTLPAESLISFGFGVVFPAGTRPPPPGAVSDGVWLMLAPLSEGQHVLHWTASTVADGNLDITYTIRVKG